MKRTISVSVLIATKNRPNRLVSCVKSLLHRAEPDFEIIIIDQSTNHISEQQMRRMRDQRIIYTRCESGGKSAALNKGIQIARGEILAFTDDDCVVAPGWIRHLVESFDLYPDAVAVTGKTLPYKPLLHKGLICPSTYVVVHPVTIDAPCFHAEYIGLGNNMAFRKRHFIKYGGFREWLGPGTISFAAEDAEVLIRALIAKRKIYYDPQAVVYHNCWLTRTEAYSREVEYLVGEMSCYSYWWVQHHSFARTIVLSNFKKVITNRLRLLVGDKDMSFQLTLRCFMACLRGVRIGWYFAKTDPFIYSKNNS